MVSTLKVLYYKYTANKETLSNVDTKWSVEQWQPSLFSIKPKGLPIYPFLIWWCFYYLKIFRNKNYFIFLVRDKERVVHRTCVFPPFFRFPFMSKGDVQVGDILTVAEYRGKGLASYVLSMAKKLTNLSEGGVWYVVENDNAISQKVARNNGFRLFGSGEKKVVFSLNILSRYIINKKH